MTIISSVTRERFETALFSLLKDIRREFNNNMASHLRLEVHVNGNPSRDLKIEFIIDDSQYGGQHRVAGADVDEVLVEHLRRRGWEMSKSANKRLTYSGDVTTLAPSSVHDDS